jgi:K+-sensing histidine kinase KdpD
MRNDLLEWKINDRTGELRVTLQELEQSQSEVLRQMHLQSRLMASIAHDVRTPLRAAIVVAKELRKVILRQQYDEALEYGQNIEDTMVQLKVSLEDLLAYVKVQVYNRELKKDTIDLRDVVEKNFHLYGDVGKMNPNQFINQLPGQLTVETNLQLLDIVLHNLIDNANKFTDGGIIKASVSQDAGMLNLVIEDTGKGIPVELAHWISEQSSTLAPGGYEGIGLVLIKELAPFVVQKLTMQPLTQGTMVTLGFAEFSFSDTSN